MAKKSKKDKKGEKAKDEMTWQQIAEAKKTLSQKAIELLDDPTKHLIRPKEEVAIHKEIKIKTQPNPTHTIVTELSTPRRVIAPVEGQTLKKILKSEIIHRQTRELTSEEIAALREEQQKTASNPEDEEDDPIKSVKEAVKKVANIFKKKKPSS